jgi:hypothetical protein
MREVQTTQSSNIERTARSQAWARPSEVCFVLPVATLVMWAVLLSISMRATQLRKLRKSSLNILNLQPLGQREPERHDDCDV